MPAMTSSDLERFIDIVDRQYGGNLNHPEVARSFYLVEFQFSTLVNEELDPFSQEYYED